MSGNDKERDTFTAHFREVIRWITILIPVPLAIFTAIASTGEVTTSRLFTPIGSIIITVLFFTLAIWHFMSKDYSAKAVALRLGLFHVVCGGYLVLVSGLSSPLVLSWLLLLLVTNVYFGKNGFFTSLATLWLLWLIAIFSGSEQPTTMLASLTMLGGVSLVSYAAVVLHEAGRKEHAELERSKAHHESDHSQLVTVLNSISVGILSTDTKGTIRLYNAALLGLLDTNESLTGKKANDVFHLIDQKGDKVELIDLVEERYMTERDDISLVYNEDDKIRLGILINPIRSTNNKANGYIFVVEDITKEKSLEEERDEFISVISHELRTPITISEGSISNAQLLLERGASKDILKTTFEEAHEQVVFLATMVNDIGTLSRAERGVGDAHEEIDVDDLSHDLFTKYAPRAEAKKLHFNLDIVGHIGTVVSSRLYLEEMLQNFITNSIKYTQEGTITLRIKRTKDGVYFGVKDTGIGIGKTDLKHIFEKFYRSEDYRTRETSGTGLGLYVVQKLARKLKVHIDVESRLNHGSTFSFVLPSGRTNH